MAPKTAGGMKQRTLSFASAKRTGSNTSAKGGKGAINTAPPVTLAKASRPDPVPELVKLDLDTNSSSSDDGDDVSEIQEWTAGDSDEDVREREREPSPPAKRRRVQPTRKVAEVKPVPVVPVREASMAKKPKLDVKDKKWNKAFGVAREKMGHLKPIHDEGKNKVHHILRVFDLSYEYGPCVGITRLQRWERADALGLNPPAEVREILLTEQGSEEDQYAQCVFYGEV